jgi:hypothetical protein
MGEGGVVTKTLKIGPGGVLDFDAELDADGDILVGIDCDCQHEFYLGTPDLKQLRELLTKLLEES